MKNPSQKMIILSLAAVTVFAAGLIWSGKATLNDGFVSSAEARIGRPLTPMSYAGVARRTTRRAVVYGGGADFKLTQRFFLRAEYRGLIYNSPTFDIAPLNNLDRVTHRAEPSIGFGYRF